MKKLIQRIRRNLDRLIKYIGFRNRHVYYTESPKVLVTFKLTEPDRKLFRILYQFINCGYDCFLDIPFMKYRITNKYGVQVINLKGEKNSVFPAPRIKKINDYSIIVSDDKKYLDGLNTDKLKIYINIFLVENLKVSSEDDMYYPILSHPNYLRSSIETDVFLKANNHERKIGAIFAGNADNNHYDNYRTKERFKINTRKEVFCYITSKIPPDILYIPESFQALIKDMEAGFLQNKIVLLNIKNNFSIPKDMYFNVLLNSDFYIHMCGYIQPFCHNQIESMMAGCIPITQFAKLFIPPFQHETNGLLYNELHELTEILTKVASGHYKDKLCYMRKNILEYFQQYYSLQSFKNKLSELNKKNICFTTYHTAEDL